jgi:biotin carboxyl carrier protein
VKFQFQIADHWRTVEVHRQADGYVVAIDGRPQFVEAVQLQRDLWSLIVRDGDGASPRSVQAVIEPQTGNGTLDVHIDGYRVPVHLRNGRGRRAEQKGAGPGAGAQRLTAPMPGKVVRVLVKPGELVKPRQVLVVVEAMKMENELRAAHGGRVADVMVREGQSVEAGTVLAVIDQTE